jgi:cytochrome c-type biogenesis protein CcmH/NrfG
VGLAFALRVSDAHGVMHAAEAGDVDRVRAAVDRTPNDAGLWELLGDAYANRSDYAQAASAYRKSIQLNPRDETTWWMLGIAEVCRNNPEGITAVRDALQRLNDDSAREFAKLAPLGCCAFGGCAK